MVTSRAISWWDTLRLQCFVVLPAWLWGVVAPRRRFVPMVVRRDLARRTMAFLAGLRERYACEHLWTWFPVCRTLLVLDPLSIDALLAGDANAADPWLKKRALSRFVPEAVIISSGDPWCQRRAFNEAVLALGRPHPQREHFARIAESEVERLLASAGGAVGWPEFQGLAERIAHQVLLGSGEIEPQAGAQLERLSAWANLGLRHLPAFRAFRAWLARQLAERTGGPPRGLMDDAAQRLDGAGPRTQVASQAGFWLFVLKDAVELHIARTLALLAAHPVAQQRARDAARAGTKPAAYEQPSFVDACLLEQMRLWTAVPLLLRRATRPFDLRGAIRVPECRQLLVHAAFHHRDPRRFSVRADRFMPEAVAGGPELLVFSRHRQACAGETLVRFVLEAVLAALLVRARFALEQPVLDPERLPLQIDHFKIRLHIEREAPAGA